MKAKWPQVFCGVCIVVAVALSGWVFQRWRERRVLSQRIEDVRVLTQAYFEYTNATSIEELIETLRQRGVRLNNPIAADPSLPCYRLVWKPDDTNTSILIEETNVLDKRIIVRSGMDGTVFIQRRDR